MLRMALMFFLIAVLAGIFGFGGIAAASADIAVLLFWLFVVLFVVSLVFGLIDRRSPPIV